MKTSQASALYAGGALIFLGLLGIVLPVFSVLPGYLMYPGVVTVTAGLLCILAWRMKAADSRREWVLNHGIHGTGEILDWWILGKSGGSLDSIERCLVDLMVRIPGGEPYKVSVKELLPHSTYTRLQKGMLLPLRIDPDRPSRVLFWDGRIPEPAGSNLSAAEDEQD